MKEIDWKTILIGPFQFAKSSCQPFRNLVLLRHSCRIVDHWGSMEGHGSCFRCCSLHELTNMSIQVAVKNKIKGHGWYYYCKWVVLSLSLTQIKLDQVMLFTLKVRCVIDLYGHVWFDQRVKIHSNTCINFTHIYTHVLRNISLYMVVKVCHYEFIELFALPLSKGDT